MGASMTIIAALKFEGGVVIASDSQASDISSRVRWEIEKLDRIGNHPLVLGFSGSVGMAERARKALEEANLHPNTFKKRDLIRDAMERCFDPIYKTINRKKALPVHRVNELSICGLAAYLAENAPQILEYDINCDFTYHDYFHAIGSGSNTAYAIWRTLGGRKLSTLNERKSLIAMLRIMRTCVNVEMWGVNEPFSAWILSASGAREVSTDELQALMEYVDEWEESERKSFFETGEPDAAQ